MTLAPGFLTHPIAHRARHGAAGPENSIPAIEAAIAQGYGIEVDIQPSACGAAMVFHDYTLKRLTGADGMINQHNREALAGLRLLGSDAQIPSLAEVLALVAGRVPLLIEIKDQDGALGPNLRGLEEAVASDLRSYNGPVAVMSFNPYAIRHFATLSPVPTGYVTCAFGPEDWPHLPAPRRAELAALTHLNDAQAQFISHQHTDLDRPEIAAFRANRPVLSWTLRSPAEEARARVFADNVTFEDYAPPCPI